MPRRGPTATEGHHGHSASKHLKDKQSQTQVFFLWPKGNGVEIPPAGQMLGCAHRQLASSGLLFPVSVQLDLLGQQFSPIANIKYDSAAADQSSRRADTRREPTATIQSFQQADTRQL